MKTEKKHSIIAQIVMTITILICVASLLTSCGNKDIFDSVYTYDYAQILMPDGSVVEGKVQKWTDYEDGDQLQITIGGKTYLTDSTRCVLISE